ncbi:MAG TPA: multiheme c-type cytochrome [Blastocatellia bacterium]|nr:multiheme c-type cytochrome [Blastocatellia bacterium]
MSVDSGYFLGDERSAHGRLRNDTAARNELVLKAYDRFKVDVANLSAHELFFVSQKFKKAVWARNNSAHPILNRLVSANIQGQSSEVISPQPFIVKEVPDRKAEGSKPIRVAFIGLAEQLAITPKGFKISDPVEAAKLAVPEARKRADVTVLLAHVKTEVAERIAREVPGVDAIIVGNAQPDEQYFIVPFRIGTTLVAFTPFETRMLGELRFYRDDGSRFTVKERFISLNGLVPDDPEALEDVNAVNKAESDTRKATEASLKEWLGSTRASENSQERPHNGAVSEYASSASCAKCHLAQYIKWNASDHSRATSALVSRPADFDASCLACHASGHKSGASTASQWAAMQNVHCEQCHGPGKDHIANPAKAYSKIDLRSACMDCHTPETSSKFDLKAYWEKIAH